MKEIMERFVEEQPVTANPEQFWSAVQIYTEKPHVLNRKVCGVTNLWIGYSEKHFHRNSVNKLIERVTSFSQKVENDRQQIPVEDNSSSTVDSEQVVYLKTALLEEGFHTYLRTCNQDRNNATIASYKQEHSKELLNDPESNSVKEEISQAIPWNERSFKYAVIIRKLHPKQLQKYRSKLEVVFIDKQNVSVIYLCKLCENSSNVPPHANYSFKWTPNGISLSIFQDKNVDDSWLNNSITWLRTNVLPKLVKWACEVQEIGLKEHRASLSLVDIQEYNQLYQALKVKYGQPLVEKWPETTDPQKFVFEDIAIATYLILLWKKERITKKLAEYQSFVDLGCGNGVLVYILTGEGHRGLGIDLKKRNIWNMFPSNVALKEGVVEPSDKNLFPEYDWLIGNHSDELTPWLPVIAAKSKYSTSFFVIPCCAHDFDCKYKRRDAGISQYADYISYIKEIGEVCGFQMWEDKLRIPSTKRVCLIGQERMHNEYETSHILTNIDNFVRNRNEVNAKLSLNGESKDGFSPEDFHHTRDDGALWSSNFKARDRLQPVRNCTWLTEDTKRDIINTVVNILLEKKHIVEVETGCLPYVVWDQGGRMNLGTLAKRLGQQQLSALKKECGGLQTLLRNHKNIFSIANGDVGLQVPLPEWKARVPKEKVKTKYCWFHQNHYQKCPLPSLACIYAHGDDDLRLGVS